MLAIFKGYIAVIYIVILAIALGSAQYTVLKLGIGFKALGKFSCDFVVIAIVYYAVYAIYIISETAARLYCVIVVFNVIAVILYAVHYAALHILLHCKAAGGQHEYHYQRNYGHHQHGEPEGYYELYRYLVHYSSLSTYPAPRTVWISFFS